MQDDPDNFQSAINANQGLRSQDQLVQEVINAINECSIHTDEGCSSIKAGRTPRRSIRSHRRAPVSRNKDSHFMQKFKTAQDIDIQEQPEEETPKQVKEEEDVNKMRPPTPRKSILRLHSKKNMIK